MTREEANETMSIVKAWAEGKTIEKRFKGTAIASWVECTDDDLYNNENFDYRIKPEPKYRPFNSLDECWAEMKDHFPFGWVALIDVGSQENGPDLICITEVMDRYGTVIMEVKDGDCMPVDVMFNKYTFADGTPFGVMEDDQC